MLTPFAARQLTDSRFTLKPSIWRTSSIRMTESESDSECGDGSFQRIDPFSVAVALLPSPSNMSVGVILSMDPMPESFEAPKAATPVSLAWLRREAKAT